MNLFKVICKKCNLKDNGKFVYGRGSSSAEIFFIGESPGKFESITGIPFVGRSGKLLSKILKEISIDENKVYISNIVKHRPPKNRKPFYDEIKACQEHLIAEIKGIEPKLIVTLGRTSGDWWNHYRPFEWGKYYSDRKWLPLQHPSYLLRKRDIIPEWKAALINTIKLLNIEGVFV